MKHPKFARLVHMLALPPAHVRGHLELLWDVAYESGSDLLGDSVDVEIAAGWIGEPGKLAEALLKCGGISRHGFVDVDESGTYRVHDLFDHAPGYVKKRREREQQRQAQGVTLQSVRARAGQKGGSKRKQLASKRNPQRDGEEANGRTTAHAPAPAPTPTPEEKNAAPAPPLPPLIHGSDEPPEKPAESLTGGAVLTAWIELHRERHLPDPLSLGPDCKAAKTLSALLMKDHREHTFPAILKAYLDDHDKWLETDGHPLRKLLARVQAYRLKIEKQSGNEQDKYQELDSDKAE
jgi:hypothetical protein